MHPVFMWVESDGFKRLFDSKYRLIPPKRHWAIGSLPKLKAQLSKGTQPLRYKKGSQNIPYELDENKIIFLTFFYPIVEDTIYI